MLSYVHSFRFLPILFVFPLLVLAGCNPDVFIEQLEASRTDFTFPMTGGEAEVRLTHGDWMLERVSIDKVDAQGWITHEGGKDEYGALYLKDRGKVRYSSEFHDFEIVRDTDDHMLMNFGQSVDVSSRLIELYLVNDFEEVVITVAIEGCCGYSFDRIEYSDVTYNHTGQYDEAWALNLSNDSDAVLVQEFDVFNDDAHWTVDIPAGAVSSEDIPHPQWYAELVRYLDGEAFAVPLPSPYLENGVPVPGDVEIPFSYGEHNVDTVLPDDKVRVELPPGKSLLRVFWEYEEYGVEYTVWLKHENGGKPLSFSGTMHSKTYTGRWVHLFGQQVEEQG